MPSEIEKEIPARQALQSLLDALSSVFTRTSGSSGIVLGRTAAGSILLRSKMSVAQRQDFDRAVYDELLWAWARYKKLASEGARQPVIDSHWCIMRLSILVGLAVCSDDAELEVLGLQILEKAEKISPDIILKLFPTLQRKQEPGIVIL